MSFSLKSCLFCGTLGALLIVSCLITTITSTEASKNDGPCGKNFTATTGNVHISNITKIPCYVNIIINQPNGTTAVYLFMESVDLHKDDVLVITKFNQPNETLFEIPHPLDGLTPIITEDLHITVQVNVSSEKYPRDVKFFYQSQSCTMSRDVGEELRLLASPLYAKDVTSKVECDYIFNQNLKKNASYVFIFEKFNISSESQFTVSGAEPKELPRLGTGLPMDLFSSEKQVKFTMNFDPTHPEDKILMRKEDLIGECTSYITVHGKDKWGSPKIEAVPDDVTGECRWAFSSFDSKPLGIEFTTVNFTDKLDIASIINGGYSKALPFYQITTLSEDQALTRRIRTSGSRIMLSFKPISFMASSLNFSVFNAEQGAYMKGNGSIMANGVAGSPNDTIFLLEVEKGQSVLLEFKSSTFASPTVLNIYDDFTTNSNLIAALKGNVWYPVLSTTTKMMVHAVNFAQGSFSASFKGTMPGCMHMSPGTSDSYILNGNCNSTCAWIIPPVEAKSELQLDLQYIALESSDSILVKRLDSNKTVVANVTFGTTRVPTFSLDSTVGAYVEVTRGSCQKSKDIVLVAQATYMPDCSKNFTVAPYTALQLTSPSYPDTYPLLSLCQYGITRTSDKQLMYMTFDKLQLAADHCVLITEITKNVTNTFTVSGSNLPDDIFYSGDAIVKFNSGKCNTTKVMQPENVYGSAQGFVMNITSTDCGGIFSDKVKVFETEVNKSMCIYKVSVTAEEKDGSVNVITFNAKPKGETGNYKLTVYDGNTMRSDKILNLTAPEVWSRTNVLIFVYEIEDQSKPASAVSIDYKTLSCNKSQQCDNKICMHPDWRCNGVNNCGDFSDESKCSSVPTPPVKPVAEGKVSGAVFGVCSVVFFLFGILSALLVPKVIDKFRNSRYHQFRDVSVVE